MNATAPAYSKPTIALALLCGALPGLFLLITSTTYLVPGEFVYDIKRLLQLCIMTALFLAATLNPGLRNAFGMQLARIPTWVKALLGLIVALGITSSIVNATSNMHLAYSLLEVALLSLLVLAALVIAACRVVAGELFDQVAITLLAMTSIAVGIQELLGVAAALANDTEFYFRISLMYYSWPRFYNQVQAWTLPVLAALPAIWTHSKSEILRSKSFQAIVCLSAISLNWYVILMTGGRGVALSLITAFVVCLVAFPSIRRAFLVWHLPGLLLGMLIYLGVGHLQSNSSAATSLPPAQQSSETQRANPEDWFTQENGESNFSRQSMTGRLSLDSSGRWYMWRGSLQDIKNHPLIGNGPMNYACLGPKHRSGHPHNFVLQFTGEWGTVASAALAIVIGFLLMKLWASRLEGCFGNLNSPSTQLCVGVVAAASYSMLSGVLVMPASHVAGILITGWLLGILSGANKTIPAPKKKVKEVSVVLIISLIAMAATTFSFSEATKRQFRETHIPTLDGGIPRYWQQGKVCKYFGLFASPRIESSEEATN